MNRRGILASVLTAAGGLFAASAANANTSSANAASANASSAKPAPESSRTPDKTKVVYHLTDLDKVGFALNNIKNHYEGVGGPANVTIVLVVYGPALKAFHAATAGPETVKRLADFSKAGLQLNVCGNTMKAQEVTLKDLLPGFVIAEGGGVVRLAELQSMGYVYIKP